MPWQILKMFMKKSNIKCPLSTICMLLLLAASSAQAQIYKWVDANGQTHYSEKKEEAGKAKTAEIKLREESAAAPAKQNAVPDWQEQEKQFKLRQSQSQSARPNDGAPANPVRGAALPKDRESDQYKCTLANAIIDGTAKHRNGVRTDNNDLDTAKSDARLFCH